jgi:hypothetical protein
MIDGCSATLVIYTQGFEAGRHYQEHAQCGKRVEASTVQPDFGVPHRSRNVLPGDALVGDCIAVCAETSGDELFLFRGDECGLSRPIHHIPVRGNSKKNCEYSLDDKDPSAF